MDAPLPPSYDEAVLPTSPPGSGQPPYPGQTFYPSQPPSSDVNQPPYPAQQPQPQSYTYGMATVGGSYQSGTAYPPTYPPQPPLGYTQPGQPGYTASPGQPIHYQHNVVHAAPVTVHPASYATTPMAYGNVQAMNNRRKMVFLIFGFAVVMMIVIMIIGITMTSRH